MNRLSQAWKAVVAFFAPGVVLAVEPLLTAGDFTRETLTRALIVAAISSVSVYLKTNGASDDLTTSTPGPLPALYDDDAALRHLDDGRALLGTLGAVLLVVAAVLTVTTLLGVLTVSWFALVATALIGLVLLLLDGSSPDIRDS